MFLSWSAAKIPYLASGNCFSHYSPCNIPVKSMSEHPATLPVAQSLGSRMWSRSWAGLVSGFLLSGSQ